MFGLSQKHYQLKRKLQRRSKMDEVDGRKVLAEYLKRFGSVTPEPDAPSQHAEERTYRWREHLFDRQIKFIDDPSEFKAAVCSRRAGKTYTLCHYLLEVASKYPDSVVAYIALTRTNAKRLMWGALKKANRDYHIGMRFNNSELTATLPNHSEIWLTGANDEADIDKLRGPNYRLVCIDEAQSYGGFLEEFIEEVLEPALIDNRGTLCLTGTPNAACAGYFHDASNIERLNYSIHHWTILENPYIPHAKDYLSKKKKQKQWPDNHPVYMREWCGQWVKSLDALVYKFSENNIYDSLPVDGGERHYILGIDLGYEDATSFSIGCWMRSSNNLWVIETSCFKKLIPSKIAEKVNSLNEIYSFERIIADTGGLGKSIVEEMRQRWAMPIVAAEKKNKAAYIELMNGDLHQGRIKVKRGEPVLEEWRLLQWDEDHRKEDSRFENHASDATLYMWREARHWLWAPELRDPRPGEDGYVEYLEQQYIDKLEKRYIKGKDKPWWMEDVGTLN
jgi:hypothetical protein